MSAGSATAEVAWATGRSFSVTLLAALYPLARCAVAALGLAHWLGAGWAAGAVLLIVCLRGTVLLQAAALVGLVSLWHWPILVALVCVAPRLVTILPGLVTTWLATLRHPRPHWDPWVPAEPRAPAATGPLAAAESPASVPPGVRSPS